MPGARRPEWQRTGHRTERAPPLVAEDRSQEELCVATGGRGPITGRKVRCHLWQRTDHGKKGALPPAKSNSLAEGRGFLAAGGGSEPEGRGFFPGSRHSPRGGKGPPRQRGRLAAGKDRLQTAAQDREQPENKSRAFVLSVSQTESDQLSQQQLVFAISGGDRAQDWDTISASKGAFVWAGRSKAGESATCKPRERYEERPNPVSDESSGLDATSGGHSIWPLRADHPLL